MIRIYNVLVKGEKAWSPRETKRFNRPLPFAVAGFSITMVLNNGWILHYAIQISRLAARAAFRPGQADYCGFRNDVELASWVGGIVGLKSSWE